MDRTPDLSFLPSDVVQVARIERNGEVAWPLADAASAINALAAAGRLVVGLDARRYPVDGGVIEIAWSSYEPSPNLTAQSNVTAGHMLALERLTGIEDFGDWVLVTWR